MSVLVESLCQYWLNLSVRFLCESIKDPTKPTTKKTSSTSSTTSLKITAKTTRKTTKAPNKEGMGILNPNLKNEEIDSAITDIRLAYPDMDLNATWALPKKWMTSRSLIPRSHKALGTVLKALSTAKVKRVKIYQK